MLFSPPFHENALILQLPEKDVMWYKLLNQIKSNCFNTRKDAKNANVNISSEILKTCFPQRREVTLCLPKGYSLSFHRIKSLNKICRVKRDALG